MRMSFDYLSMSGVRVGPGDEAVVTETLEAGHITECDRASNTVAVLMYEGGERKFTAEQLGLDWE